MALRVHAECMDMEPADFVTTRSNLGLSQAGIATALGVDQGTISRWETGKTRIPAAIKLALAALQEKQPMAGHRPRILVADPVANEGVEMLRAVAHVDVRTGMPIAELIATIGA